MISDDIIHEAQNYEVMFNDILKVDTNPRLQQEITRDINWARKTLRKNDRIIWFLRWSKIWYQLSGGIWAGGRADTSLSGALQQYNQRFQTRYVAGDLRSPPVMKTQVEHFLGLPVPEMQTYVFRTESPKQLFELFTKYEAVWRQRIEEEKSIITPEPEDEILISFADGYAWWLLPRGGCGVEAEAMGHCGNVPSQRPGDQILSLRRQVRLDLRSRATPQGGLRGEAPTEGSTRGDVIRWYPVATFILDDDGKLGEMKGRGNDKPAAKYHPYVVELLRHHLISGIKGGGYMPENNFSMSDLDPQTRDQLIAAKPELKGLLGYYEEEGMTERVLDMLESSLRERDLPDYERFDPVKRDFILSMHRDLAHFVSTTGDDILEQLLELRERALDSHSDALSVKATLTDGVLRRFLEMLPHRAFADIATSIGIDDEHAYDAQKVAHNRSWDALDLESTFEHRRENGLIRRKSVNRSWEYEDTKFSDPESIKFDTDDLIDAAVEVYLNPRKSSPTIRDPRQFELTLEALRRRAGIAQVAVFAIA